MSDDITKLMKRNRTLDSAVRGLQKKVTRLEEKAERKREVETADTKPLPIDSLERDGQGRVIVQDGLPTDVERDRARREREKQEQNAYWNRATAGLAPGYYRDPCGIVRRSDGTQAGKEESTTGPSPVEPPSEWTEQQARRREEIGLPQHGGPSDD